jgi:hypothetical protein
MLRLTGSALALLVAFSIVPLAASDAGHRSGQHRIVKHQKFRMVSDRHHRHHRRHIRVVNRSVVVVNVNAAGRRHYGLHRQGDTYSGDVVIDVRSGVGQWSYGTLGVERMRVSTPSAKIIDVGTMKPGNACKMQAGVCMIKP